MDWQIVIKNIIRYRWLLVAISTLFLWGCRTVHSSTPTSADQIQSTMQQSINTDRRLSAPSRRARHIPANVNDALLPPLSRYVNPARETEPRFDVSANKIPAKEFFIGLVAYLSLNALSPIFGTVTFWGVFLQGFISGILGIAAGIFVLHLLKNEELAELIKAFRTKFWRKKVILPTEGELP